MYSGILRGIAFAMGVLLNFGGISDVQLSSVGIAPDDCGTVSELVLSDGLPDGTTALFIGNSLVEGMRVNCGGNHRFFCEVGISLSELNGKLELPDGYDIVIIEMGSNELGAYSEERFVDEYVRLIESIGCDCYCLSIPPVNEGKSRYGARICNENVGLYNQYVEEACERTGSVYVDCSGFFGETLDGSWTGDGLHMCGKVYRDWYRWVLAQIGLLE